ncbi:hypothetical protein [Devriesea agamarum]|uniref:hypothetical protein n=1 Tax=Devriesea agamarum TaxID=472569 RepID=UPI0012EDFC82|nr:hypothetical protein [Devriesea agamarum]
MTFFHLLLVALGVVVALVAADIFGHRGWDRWPLVLAALILVVTSGYLYSAELLAFTFGASLAISCVTVVSWGRSFARTRQRYKEAREARRREEQRRKNIVEGRD